MRAMRWVFVLAGVTAAALQTGCGATPASLGITGPGSQPPPAVNSNDSTIMTPGVTDPNTGSGIDQHFYNYN